MENVHEDEQRVKYSEREKKLEEENKHLLVSIDLAIEESRENLLELNALLDENENLKGIVSKLQNECSEIDKGVISPKLEGGDYVKELEDKHKKSEDELKLKVKQFENLQEVHKKLLDELHESRSEWETEKSSFVGEIFKLNALVDENESLKSLVSKLQNECLEIEKGVISPKLEGGDYVKELEDKHKKSEDELKLKVEQFEHLQEIHEKLLDELRDSRSEWGIEKSSFVDEIFKLNALGDENESLKGLVSKLQNEISEIGKGVISPNLEGGDYITELEDKLKTVEDELKLKTELCKHLQEVHENHLDELRKSKSEWETEKSSLVEEIIMLHESLDDRQQIREGHKSEGNMEGSTIGEEEIVTLRHSLRIKEMECMDLEYNVRQLEQDNQELQEAHITKTVASPSAWAKLRNKLKSSGQTRKEREAEWNSRTEKITRELNRCSSSLQIKDQVINELKKELERYKEIAEQAAEIERKLNDELQAVYNTLDNIDSEFTDKANEASELGLELQSWTSIADRLQMHVEESQEIRRALETSLLTQAEVEEKHKQYTKEKDRTISNLEKQILIFKKKFGIEDYDILEEDVRVSQLSQMDDNNTVEEMLKQDTEEKDEEDPSVH